MESRQDTSNSMTSGMVSPAHLIANLDLSNLPERLDDATLDRLKEVARLPLPPEDACDARHFGQCLRIMLAVLPKRSQDDLSGELFVAAYQRKLGDRSNAAISFLADKAMERCQWFPTIAECLDILSEYRRSDELLTKWLDLRRIVSSEEKKREIEGLRFRNNRAADLTQEDVDAMPDYLKRIGIAAGALMVNEKGRTVLQPAIDWKSVQAG